MKTKNGSTTFSNPTKAATLDKGRPVKPHRSGGGLRPPSALKNLTLPNYLQPKKAT